MEKQKQVIAIVFSDLHLNIYAKFNEDNERTLNHFRVLSTIQGLCKKYNCPALFCGDLFIGQNLWIKNYMRYVTGNLINWVI